jgi:hypothetical protein
MANLKLNTIGKKTRVKTKVKVENNYFGSIVSALIQYARYDEKFRQDFKELILKNIKLKKIGVETMQYSQSAIQMPENRITAQARALWLIKNKDLIPESVQIMLSSWALVGENTAPQQLLVGFVGVAIPGPTLGLISKKKKITMIMKKSALKLKTARLIEKTTTLSLDIVSQALARTDGETTKLDPDTSDWFFGERGLKLYEAEDEEFEKIKKEVRTAKIINSISEIEGKEAILAISPSLNKNYLKSNWKIKVV